MKRTSLIALAVVVAAALLVPMFAVAQVDPHFLLAEVAASISLAGIQELRQQRAKLVADAQEILTKHHGQEIPKEEEARFDKLMADADKLADRIKREERAYDAAREMDEVARNRRSGREDPSGERPQVDMRAYNAALRKMSRSGRDSLSADEVAVIERQEVPYRSAFRNWMMGGNENLAPEERQVLSANRRQLDSEERAQAVTTTGGGYLIPQDFQREIEVSMLDYSGVLAAPTTKLRTDTGAQLPWPTVDDTTNTGQLLAINTQETAVDLVYGQVLFGAYKFSSRQVLVPVELMQDSAFDVDAHVRDRLAERLGRVLEVYLTRGTGSSQPKGIVVGAGSGTVLSGASNVTALAYTDLVDLQHSVDRAYRKGAGWMFHDSTLKYIKKLVDSQNRPLWLPGVAMREPDSILGDPYFINQQMAPIGGGNKSVIYGNLSKYVVRMVKDMTLVRFAERYMDYFQIGFQAFMRADGQLLDSGTDPITYLQHPTA